mmetsp:Transcript_4136/g.7994  ORF Transcript_4136/g.7994 Transcript_4136/m.7994 type:complete len:264 (+) Transcript_4136:1795-2586(+)
MYNEEQQRSGTQRGGRGRKRERTRGGGHAASYKPRAKRGGGSGTHLCPISGCVAKEPTFQHLQNGSQVRLRQSTSHHSLSSTKSDAGQGRSLSTTPIHSYRSHTTASPPSVPFRRDGSATSCPTASDPPTTAPSSPNAKNPSSSSCSPSSPAYPTNGASPKAGAPSWPMPGASTRSSSDGSSKPSSSPDSSWSARSGGTRGSRRRKSDGWRSSKNTARKGPRPSSWGTAVRGWKGSLPTNSPGWRKCRRNTSWRNPCLPNPRS